ncbi:NADH-quinone oxidoreductase chain J [Granulibacter bethesdensis]|uniref:NADH-quinone oxidoreductase subunit J n=2 Tax=Granulibacter bethesdensis TaxID=364410 RepID=A0AAC9KE80_9PROT|nr:NADH-quinone oxidoreductase chain J [Granulibacter bethesdensis]APH62179.1 NADH-quinone oxidoreductase chain J [Granulibacter bethesdensis]
MNSTRRTGETIMIAAIAFYVFSAILIVSGAMVVSARNPVHAVLFLILAFFNAAGLFLLTGAEFLAMILVIVYVGAVAVLFLFVVMMLNINFAEVRDGWQRYAPVGAAIGGVLLVELAMVLGGWQVAPGASALRFSPRPDHVQNTVALGQIVYTHYVMLFQMAGLILLVAMIGAIVLTLRDRKTSRHQNIAEQVNRRIEDTLKLVNTPVGQGIHPEDFLRPLPPASSKPVPSHGQIGHDDHGAGTHLPQNAHHAAEDRV